MDQRPWPLGWLPPELLSPSEEFSPEPQPCPCQKAARATGDKGNTVHPRMQMESRELVWAPDATSMCSIWAAIASTSPPPFSGSIPPGLACCYSHPPPSAAPLEVAAVGGQHGVLMRAGALGDIRGGAKPFRMSQGAPSVHASGKQSNVHENSPSSTFLATWRVGGWGWSGAEAWGEGTDHEL